MTRTLVVWYPDWPMVAAGVGADEPAAAFHANRVVACTVAARDAGVVRGMRRREAQSRCPELGVHPHDPVRDARVFEPIVATVETLTPRVEVTRPGVCAFPTRGPSRYFGGDGALAQRVRELIPGCQVGIADSPFAASHAARRDLVIPIGGNAEFLAPLPINTLDEPELTDLLVRLGLRTMGALAALSPGDVVGRFGPVGALAHRRVRGLDDRDLNCRTPPPDLTTEISLDPPADRVDIAAFAGKSMADQLCVALLEAGLVCTCVRIEAETEHGDRLSRIWRHHVAFSPAAVAERVRWQLEGWDITEGLTLLRLVPEDVEEDRGRQRGFWGEATEADHRAARGLARVQGLLGPDAVVTAALGGGRGPRERVELIPWGSPLPPPASGKEIPTWPGRVPSPSPVLVPADPIPAVVLDAGGDAVGVTGRSFITAPPARLSIDSGPWEEIRSWAGPWTADERWWDPPVHRRSARLQVVLARGTAHLITLHAGRWWIEGTYD